jgi:PAS domain S-box-containing protein
LYFIEYVLLLIDYKLAIDVIEKHQFEHEILGFVLYTGYSTKKRGHMSRDNDKHLDGTQHDENTNLGNSTTMVQDIQADLYRTLFEMLPSGVLYYDARGHLLVANPAAQRIPGLSLEQLRNHNPPFLLCDNDGRPLREEEWPLHRILAGEILQDATAIDVTIHGAQERHMNVSGQPLYDPDGKVRGAIITFQDVTIQRNSSAHTQRSLHAILAMADAMVQHETDWEATIPLEDEREVAGAPLENESSDENLFESPVLELPCRLLNCQRAAIVLIDSQTEVLIPITIFGISPEYEQHWYNSLHGARLHSMLGSQEFVDRLHAGEMLSLDSSHQLFRDLPSYKLIIPILKNGELIGLFLIAYSNVKPDLTPQDLTIIHAVANLAALLIEREKALQERNHALQMLQNAKSELERTSKVKGDFLGIVSHEFRTALTGIQGFSEIMRDKDLSVVEMKEFAIDIHTDARRLVRLITGMLDIDHREAPHLQLNPTWLDLNAIIIDVVVRMRQMNSGFAIHLQLANALPILRGDYEKLTSVVANLLQNAILHSLPGAEIAVSSQIEGNVVHICVRDYGAGLSATELERVFEPRMQNDGPSTFHIEDSQPELSIVRDVVQMHGGQVWAESVPGKGSIFHFTIRFTNTR